MEDYIRILTEQIRCVRAREDVAREIRTHIQDQASFYEKQGMGREEALRKAVRDMGDPVSIGVEMDTGSPISRTAFRSASSRPIPCFS